MKDSEIIARIEKFCDFYKDKGYEKGESQAFWLTLLLCLGIENPNEYISFEDQVMLDHTSFIDGYISATHVLIEQKGQNKDLDKAIRQSDGSMLTPFQQAKRYSAELPFSKRPRWIVTCNFQEFRIYDMETPNAEPGEIKLADLPKEYYRLNFLVNEKSDRIKQEVEVSVKAGAIVGKLYNALLKRYVNPDAPETLKSINVLCVRLVFCMYAEDAGIFGRHGIFTDFLKKYDAEDIRDEIVKLFEVLNTPIEERSPYLKSALAAFPYVNGGLFAKEDIEIPVFNDEIINLLINDAGEGFDWRSISPTVFGACFESTLNPDTRRSGGMHYTSIENIHKVIDPLFLNDLEKELNDILEVQAVAVKRRKLDDFQTKIAGLHFMDPACGSGNFLTETYLCLRRLENTVIAERIALEKGQAAGQVKIGEGLLNPIKVSIGQFSGIEINDFAVSVAKTALWIAESQMMRETEKIVHMPLDFLPLKTDAHIIEGNALTMDWNEVCDKRMLNCIMGNPPFVGQQLRTPEQSQDMFSVFGKGSPETKLDYVLCWYKKALDLMRSTTNEILAAFVSTNSICQGESVPTFWRRMNDAGMCIFFAHRSFKWSSESNDSAMVMCVVVGFTKQNTSKSKYIFENNLAHKVEHINAYLQDAPDIWIVSRSNSPYKGLPKMIKGSEPTDGRGNLLLSIDDKNQVIKKYPILSKYIKPFIGGDEFIKNKQGEFSRFCLWFYEGESQDYSKIPEIRERLKKVSEARRNSTAERIRRRADYPYLFCQIRQPENDFIVFPRHSTSNRRYIPLGYVDSDKIVGDSCYILPNASLLLFGILTSNVHMSWMRLICGRLGNAYRYSPAIYNNFPWPSPTDAQKAKIEKTAQGILDARANHPESSLADLYDPLTMPGDLLKAHQDNDRAVMRAYGLPVKGTSESDCVAHLMKMYQELTNQ